MTELAVMITAGEIVFIPEMRKVMEGVLAVCILIYLMGLNYLKKLKKHMKMAKIMLLEDKTNQ